MEKQARIAGALLLVLALLVTAGYAYILFFTDKWVILVKATVMLLAALASLVLAWLGITLLTVKPPESLERVEEQIRKEFELAKRELEEGDAGDAG